MKRLISCLLVIIMLCSLTITLVSCDSDELKKLSYIDENGNESTITIKKTSDVDTVTASLVALSDKTVDRTNLSSLLNSILANIVVAGTKDGEPFTYSLNGSFDLGISLDFDVDTSTFTNFLNSFDVYANVHLNGTLPKNLLFNVEDAEGENDNGEVNYLIPVDCSFDSTMFLNHGVFYAKANASDTMTNKMKNYYTNIDKISENYGCLALGEIKELLDYLIKMNNVDEILAQVRSNSSYLETVLRILEIEEMDDKPEDADETDIHKIKAFYYNKIKEFVTAFHVQIVKTKGSVVTIAFNFTQDAIAYLSKINPTVGEYFEGYEGNSSFEIIIDAANMIDATLSFDATDILSYICNKHTEGESITITSVSATGCSSLVSNVKIPQITQEEVDNCILIKPLEVMGLAFKVMQIRSTFVR